MPGRIVRVARRAVDRYGADASTIWSGNPTADELQKRFDDFAEIRQKAAKHPEAGPTGAADAYIGAPFTVNRQYAQTRWRRLGDPLSQVQIRAAHGCNPWPG